MNRTLVSIPTSILENLKAGNKQAQRTFYMTEYDRLVRISLKYVKTKNEAITIVNDSFMKIFKTIKSLKEEEKLREWTAAITRNTTLDYVRKRVTYDRRHTEIDEHVDVSITVNKALESLSMEDILKQVHSLKDKERIVFCMYAIDGYKHVDIANLLKISEGTSKWYLNKARKNLQLILKPYMS